MAGDQTQPLRVQNAPFATTRAILALMLREMSSTYGRSPGGYVWAILEPAAGIALLTIVFSAGFRSPPLGTNFAFFYAGGILPFLMYSDVAGKVGATIQYSRALLAYPRVTFVDALIARLLLNTMTHLMVHGLVVSFIVITQSPDTTMDFSKILVAYCMLVCLSAGVGTMNSFLTLSFPIWQTAWAVFNRPMFLISGIFFIYENVPWPFSEYLWYNPLIHVTGMMRDGFYPYYQPDYITPGYPIGIGIALTVLGLLLLYRFHRDILDK